MSVCGGGGSKDQALPPPPPPRATFDPQVRVVCCEANKIWKLQKCGEPLKGYENVDTRPTKVKKQSTHPWDVRRP